MEAVDEQMNRNSAEVVEKLEAARFLLREVVAAGAKAGHPAELCWEYADTLNRIGRTESRASVYVAGITEEAA